MLVIRQKEFHGCVVIQPGTGRNLIKEYDFIYGHYRQRTDDEIHFLSFQDSNRHELTNEPEEDADDLSVGYLGSSWRTELSWTTSQRSTHFNSMARRGVIAECYAQK